MELLEGDPLDRVLGAGRALDFGLIRSIGREVASVLQAAHDAGIVHRDIKPANLILTPGGSIKVTDFGVAKVAGAAMTSDGTLLGSPGYMSPEQVQSAEVDGRSDIFSLGTVLYELSTLKRAFPGKNLLEVMNRVAKGDVRDPREHRLDIPADLVAVIRKAMARRREDRFATAREMMEALAEPRSEAPLPAPTVAKASVVPAPPLAERLGATARDLAWRAARRAKSLPRPRSSRGRAGLLAGAALAALVVVLLVRSGSREGLPGAGANESEAGGVFRVAVEHDHLLGDCAGTLTIAPAFLGYDALANDEDDRSWSYDDISGFRHERGSIELTARGGQLTSVDRSIRRYTFRARRGSFPPEAIAALRSRLAR
jgi:hypothetical protein